MAHPSITPITGCATAVPPGLSVARREVSDMGYMYLVYGAIVAGTFIVGSLLYFGLRRN